MFIQAHEPAGSAAISGGVPGPFLIQGWTGSVMPHWNPDRVDHVEAIPDDDAVEMTTSRASGPPDSDRKRDRIWRCLSFSSAPPMISRCPTRGAPAGEVTAMLGSIPTNV